MRYVKYDFKQRNSVMSDDPNQSSETNLYDRMVDHLGDFMSKVISEEDDTAESPSLYKKLEAISGRYGSRKLIAQGGMKEIYEVEDLNTGRPVAMAIIKNLKSRELIEQFIQEARITARLEHPNIMPVYDIGIEDSGQAYFTMKLVKADNLGDILKKLRTKNKEYIDKYPLNRLLEIFCDICDAVAFAHSKGVQHLDLKPDNVQVGDFGEVLVCDWGLSRFKPELATEEDANLEYTSGQLTIHGQVFGSPGFMSPEQASEGRETLDHSSDIYSLGCLLYAILTLKPPISGESLEELIENTAKGDFLPPAQFAKHRMIPEALDAVCLQAMEYEPEDRYESALELKKDIRSFLNGFATFAQKAGVVTQFLLFCRRQKALVSVAVLAIGISGGLFYTTMTTESENKRVEKELVIKEKENEKVVKALDVKTAQNEKLFESIEIIRKKVNLFNNINIFSGLNKISNRDFLGAALDLEASEDESFLPYVELCRKIGDQYINTALPRIHLYDLIALLNKDLYTSLIQRLLQSEQQFLPEDEVLPLVQDLLNMANPECDRVNLAVQTVFGRTYVSLAGNTQLQDISALTMISAQYVDLSGTAVSDLSALSEMPLVSLNVRGTQVQDLAPLKKLPLNSLDISYSRVKDFEDLKYLPLVELKVCQLEPEYDKFLGNLQNLKALFVSYKDQVPELLPGNSVVVIERQPLQERN